MAQPTIGLTLLDHEMRGEMPGGYAKCPWYAVRENHCRAVQLAGGLRILLPHKAADAEASSGGDRGIFGNLVEAAAG